MDECAGVRSRAATAPEPRAAGPAAPGARAGSLVMVECDLYFGLADARERRDKLPDILPYACFYSAPRHQVLKAGWLDKLSPQG